MTNGKGPPTARSARLPDDFGAEAPDVVLPWDHVVQRMSAAEHYWLASLGADGAPYVRPVGGMWVDDALYCGGSPKSVWMRNVITDGRVTVHLSEQGDQAVILDGQITIETCEARLASRLVEVSNAKYGYGQVVSDYEEQPIMVFRPHVVFAWTDVTSDPTPWVLPSIDDA